jgi:hypothetical protein
MEEGRKKDAKVGRKMKEGRKGKEKQSKGVRHFEAL